MTLSGFIAMPRKPGKTKVGQILKNIGFKDKGASGNMWVFGKTRFRVDVVDFRDDVRDHEIEWVEEVGWQDNWAVRIQVNHSNRTDENYIFWHALLVILSDCFGVREIWLDGGSGIPQQPYTLRELFPELKSDEGEDLVEESDFGPVVINQVQPHPSELPDIEPEPKPEPEPEPEPIPDVPPDTIANEEEADNVVQFLCDTADRFAGKTEGELIQWWQYPETKKTADLLDQGYPEHYKQLMAHLSALRASLKESNDE